jgi:4-amino-4-deoxy-L-arabinose transferase-like glycosyltransferase
MPSDSAARDARRRRDAVWVAAATIVGAILRIVSTGNGSIWRDEGATVFVVRMPTVGGMLEFLGSHESHPPLFFLLLRGWAAIAGTSESALAALPIAAAVALIPLVWYVGARAFSRPAGLAAAWIVATHPALLHFSPQIRYYSVYTLLALVSCYAMWRLAEGAGWKAWGLYVASSVAMLLTHNWGWLILGAQGMLLAALVPFRYTLPARRDLALITVAWLAIAIGYLPWLPSFLNQLHHASPPPGTGGVGDAFAFMTGMTIGSPQRRLAMLLGAALIAAVLVAAAQVRGRGARDATGGASGLRAFVLIALVPWFITLVAGLVATRTDLMVSHTAATLVPFVALLLGHGIVTLARDVHPAAAAVAAGAALGLAAANATRFLTPVKSNAADVAEAVAAKARPDDVVIVAPEWLASSFNFYYKGGQQQIVYPHFRRIEMSEWDNRHARTADTAALDAARDTIGSLHAQGRRVWLIEEMTWAGREVPDVRELPEATYGRYEAADLIRAAQLRRHLVAVYGPPDTAAVPPDTRRGREMLRAWLFEAR